MHSQAHISNVINKILPSLCFLVNGLIDTRLNIVFDNIVLLSSFSVGIPKDLGSVFKIFCCRILLLSRFFAQATILVHNQFFSCPFDIQFFIDCPIDILFRKKLFILSSSLCIFFRLFEIIIVIDNVVKTSLWV